MLTNMKIAAPAIIPNGTVPAKIIDMKVRMAPVNPRDGQYDGERIKISFTYSISGLEQTTPKFFLVSLYDMVTNKQTSSMIDAHSVDQFLWTDFFGKIKNESYQDKEFNFSNYQVTVTPINDFGEGPSSIFFVALFNSYSFTGSSSDIYHSNALYKYWPLFSKTPETRKNRPKVMHIYLDVDEQVVEEDRDLLSDPAWKFTGIGNWETTNQEMYRWLWSTSKKKLDENGWFEVLDEEKKFIESLLKEVRSLYMYALATTGIQYGDEFVFKVLLANPRDELDSIQLYIMKGTKWQL